MKREQNNMNDKFDEPTKSLARSVTRRATLKKFGVGLARITQVTQTRSD